MISLSTEEGDVILDPFAGIGSVPAMAEVMGRQGIGLDLSQNYVDEFEATRARTQEWFVRKAHEVTAETARRGIFYQTIVELRLLKYGSLLGKQLEANGFRPRRIHVVKSVSPTDAKFKIVAGDFLVALADSTQSNSVLQFLEASSNQRPLSKFGIDPTFQVTGSEEPRNPKYYYEGGKFWECPKSTIPPGNGWVLTSDFAPPVESITEREAE